eukprot:17110_1
MSTNLPAPSTKWHNLTDCATSSSNDIDIPMGIDRNNYIVINHTSKLANCIYKYDVQIDKWIFMNGFKNSYLSAALDVTKQILFLFCRDCLTQISLTDNHISNYNHNIERTFSSSSQSVKVNDS